MLVLSRKINQVIKIGDDIEVMVLQLKGGVVRLGIVAPRDVPVVRQELMNRRVSDAPCPVVIPQQPQQLQQHGLVS